MRERLTSTARKFQRDILLYRMVLGDSRTPWPARVFLGAAVMYALSPIDIIPDFIPIIGHLDDLIIVPALVIIALKMIPNHIIDEHRRKLESGQESSAARTD